MCIFSRHRFIQGLSVFGLGGSMRSIECTSGSWFIRRRRRIRRHESTSSACPCCLLYLVPSDPYVLEILANDSPPVLTWAPRTSPETIGFPMMSLSSDPVTFHAWKMSVPPRSAACLPTWEVQLPLWLSHMSPYPSRKCPGCFAAILWCAASSFFIWMTETGTVTVTWRELVLI